KRRYKANFNETARMLGIPPDELTRRALTVAADLAWASRKGFNVILRHKETGAEYDYSPKRPQRATLISGSSTPEPPAHSDLLDPFLRRRRGKGPSADPGS